MDEIARDGGQRGEAVCQRLEDGAGHERPALHVTRRYVTANCRLRRNFCGPQQEKSRTTTWKEFIRLHMDVLAGVDFFTVELLTWRGLVTYYVLFFIQLSSRRVSLGGSYMPSGLVLDGAGGAQCNHAGHRISERYRYLLARSQQEVL